ncbi:MAG: SCO family protein [Thiohalophilus sp.]
MRAALPPLAALGVAATGLLIAWQVTLGFQAFTWESYRRIAVARTPVAVPDVTLQTHTGKRMSLPAADGRLQLVNFFYSRCQTLCRYSGTVYARLLQTIEQRGWQDRIRLISLSLEPDYDAPARLRDYRQRYRPANDVSWITARSRSDADQQRLLEAFGVVSIPDPWGGIQHNAAIHLVDRDGRLIRIIDDTDFEHVLAQITPLLEQHVASAH